MSLDSFTDWIDWFGVCHCLITVNIVLVVSDLSQEVASSQIQEMARNRSGKDISIHLLNYCKLLILHTEWSPDRILLFLILFIVDQQSILGKLTSRNRSGQENIGGEPTFAAGEPVYSNFFINPFTTSLNSIQISCWLSLSDNFPTTSCLLKLVKE